MLRLPHHERGAGSGSGNSCAVGHGTRFTLGQEGLRGGGFEVWMGRRVGGTIGKLAHRHRARLSHRGRPATGGTIMKAPTGATFSPEGIAPDQNRDLEPSLAFLLRLGPSRLSQGGQPGPAGIAYQRERYNLHEYNDGQETQLAVLLQYGSAF